MKKSRILMIAAVLCGTIGVVSSCSDYDSDYVRDLQNRADFLTDSVRGLDQAIKVQAQALEQAKTQLTNALNQARAELQTSINSKADTAKTNQLTSLIQKIEGVLGVNLDDAASIAQKTNLMSTLQSCLASISAYDTYYTTRFGGDYSKLMLWNDSVTTAVTTADQALLLAGNAMQLAKNDSARVDTLAKNVYSKISAVSKDLGIRIDTLSDYVDIKVADLAQSLGMTIEELGQSLGLKIDSVAENLGIKIDSVNNALDVKIDGVSQSLNLKVDTLTQQLGARVDTLAQGIYARANAVLDSACSYADKNAAELAILLEGKADTASLSTLKALSEQADQVLQETIDSIAAAGLELQESVEDLQASFDSLKARVDTVEIKLNQVIFKLDSIADEFTALSNRVDSIQNSLASMVTGISVQTVENVLWGSFYTPFGINANIIYGNYGKVAGSCSLNFPTKATAADYGHFVGEEPQFVDFSSLNPKGAIRLTGGQALAGPAGKVYLTVNPIDVDFDGMKVVMVDSRGNKAPGFDSLTLKKSNALLTYGVGPVTKAVSENYLYEAEVKINPAKAYLSQPSINTTALKKAASDLKDNWKSVKNIANLAKTIATEVNGSAIAYGVKCSYLDGFNNTRSLVSDYDMAAITFQPLSYSFAKGKVIEINKRLPMLPNLQEWLAEKGISLEPISIDPITGSPMEFQIRIPDVNSLDINITDNGSTATGTLSGSTVEITSFDLKVSGTVSCTDSTTLTITVPADKMQPLLDQVNEKLNGMLDKANSIINLADGYVDMAQSKVIDRINGYITRINNLIPDELDINMFLQPTIFFNNGAGSLSELNSVQGMGSTMSQGSTATLILSSYTAELLAPAYKKYVAVIGAPSEAAKSAANNQGNLNTVLDGNTLTVQFTPSEKGEYEIAYSAVDYSGNVATRKFYIEVK